MNNYIILDIAILIQNDIDLLPILNLYLPKLSSQSLYLAPSYYHDAKKYKYEMSRILSWGTILHTFKECYVKYSEYYPDIADYDMRDVIRYFGFWIYDEYDILYTVLTRCRKGKILNGRRNLPKYYYFSFIDILLQIAYKVTDKMKENSKHFNNVYEAFFGCLLKNFNPITINDPNINYLLYKLLNKLKPHFNMHNKLLGWACSKSATPLVKLMIEDGATTCSNSLCYLSIAEHPLKELE